MTESKPDMMSATNPSEQSIPTPSPALSKQNSVVTNNDVDNMNFDTDMDDLLSGVDGGGDGMTDDDLLNLDIDDAELLDLENFLNKA